MPTIPTKKCLQVSDLNDRDQIVTIERVVHHKFHEIGEDLILDPVNSAAIEDKYGVNPDDWIEKSIQLYASQPEHAVQIRPRCRSCGHWNGYMEGVYCGICYLNSGVYRKSREHRQETSDNSQSQDG